MKEEDGVNWREHPCYERDPLPEIKPALLNSLDIHRYVKAGCLLEEDNYDRCRMKPASYEMRFLGDLYDWQERDGRLERRCRKVRNGKRIVLRKNSISYLWTEERLRLPEYIAARFNLRIRDVHKGILLGTGPLIDPGFGGRIFVPLHNLTDTDYPLTGGEGIIWVEFTKVSKNNYWLPNLDAERPEDLVPFPKRKLIDDPDSYLVKAGAAAGVQSAFKGELDRTTRVAESADSVSHEAKIKVDDLEKQVRRWGLGGVIVGAVALVALLVSAYSLTFPVMEKVHGQASRIGELEKSVEEILDGGPKRSVVAPRVDAEVTPGSVEEAGSDARESVEGEPPQSTPSESASADQGV